MLVLVYLYVYNWSKKSRIDEFFEEIKINIYNKLDIIKY